MKVTITESALRSFFNEMMTIPTGPQTPVNVTEPPLREPPIGASENAQVEGIFDLPPVEDDRYNPTCNADLSRAAYALAKQVPPRQIERFYKRLVKLIQDAEAWQQKEDLSMGTVEERLRLHIRKMIKEVLGGEDDYEHPESFISGMASDLEEDEPGSLDIAPEELAASRKAGWAAAGTAADQTPAMKRSNLSFAKKVPKLEPWEKAGYVPEEPAGTKQLGDRESEPSLQQVADDMGVSVSSIKSMEWGDRVNTVDKFKSIFGAQNLDKMLSDAAVEWMDKLESKGLADNEVKLHAAVAYGQMSNNPVETPEQIRAIVAKPGFDDFALAWLESHTDPTDYLDYNSFRNHFNTFIKRQLEEDPTIKQRLELFKLPAAERKKKEAELGLTSKK